jgi:hypothetical protein
MLRIPRAGAVLAAPRAEVLAATHSKAQPGRSIVAEINVEHRKRSPLPLIIGLILLGALLYLLYDNVIRDDDADDDVQVETTTTTTP